MGLRVIFFWLLCLLPLLAVAEDLPSTVEQLSTAAAVSTPQIPLEATRAQQLELTASQQLQTGRADSALKTLAAVDAQHRSAGFSALLGEALRRVITEDLSAEIFLEPKVLRLLQDPAGRSAMSQAPVVEFFVQQLKTASLKQDVQMLERFFDLTIGARPDPSEANDALRFEIALLAKSEEMLEFAQGRIAELQAAGALSFWRRVRLLLAGYWGRGVAAGFIAVLLLTIAGILFGLRRLFAAPVADTTSVDGKAHRGPAYAKVSAGDDEYSELLKVFGLTDQATEEQIKAAYRRLIRDYHPDTSSIRTRDNLDDGALARKFNELKGKYERILEIRKGFFGG